MKSDDMLGMLDASTATWEEAKGYLERWPAAVLPLGATEQHGPHLPQNTDTILAWEVARRVAERTAGYLLPPIPVTYSWVWRGFAGSLWLRAETFAAVIRDLVKALEGSVRAMYILSGHGANQALLKYAVRDLHDQCSVAILYGVLGVPPEVAEETESELWIGSYEHHSDEIETSLMLAVRPDLVRMDRAVSDYPPIPVDYGRSATSMGDLARTGVFGDATKASQEKGIRWLEALVEWHARQWREFLAHHQILVPP